MDAEEAPQPVWEGPLDADGLPHGQVRNGCQLPSVGQKEGQHSCDWGSGEASSCLHASGPASLQNCPRCAGLQRQGKMTYPPKPPASEEEEEKPGDTYVGAMEHGVRHGRGRYSWGASGAHYDGDYVSGARAGSGTMKFPGGGSYSGGWAGDAMEGEGVYTYANGDVYSGGFVGGRKHGSGLYHCKADGCQLRGVWREGEMVEGSWLWRDGSSFTGSFDASRPAEGVHFFARSGLAQEGRYAAGGAWQGAGVAAPAGACC